MDNKQIKARQKARKLALQALYQWEIAGTDLTEIEAEYMTYGNMQKVDVPYFRLLFYGVPKNLTTLDEVYTEYLDRNLEKLSLIERLILRLGAYELKWCLDVPCKVVINESLTLASDFGASKSYKFVNGVIDKAARKIRASEFR